MLVADEIVRYSAQGTVNDRPWANIWDVRVNQPLGDSRETAIETVAKRLFESYTDNLVPVLGANWQIQRIRWVDLDTDTGSTGETTQRESGSGSVAGTFGFGEGGPGSMAALVTKRAGGGRGSRNGRAFICGLTEEHLAGNIIKAASLTSLQNAMNAFKTQMTHDGAGDTVAASTLVVVHTHAATPGAPPTATGVDDVSALEVQSRLATQRRRLRG